MYEEDIVVIDDIIEERYQNRLEKFLMDEETPWNLCHSTVSLKSSYNEVFNTGINPPQFVKEFPLENKYNPNIIFIKPLVDAVSLVYNQNLGVLRSKFNLLTLRNDDTFHYPHADVDMYDKQVMSCVYYVNDTDGDTYFFKEFAPKKTDQPTIERRVTPKKGSIVLFDARRYHASSSPIHHEYRIVFNMVFFFPDPTFQATYS